MRTRRSAIGEGARDEAGFTLIELLVVIAVLALMMAIVPAFLPGAQSKAELKSAARQIAAALRETRSQAIASGRDAAFTIDTAAGGFRAGGGPRTQHLPKSVHSTVVTTTQEQVADAVGSIRFFADGSSTGGGVRLAQGTRRTDILVDWLSGRISIDEAGAGS